MRSATSTVVVMDFCSCCKHKIAKDFKRDKSMLNGSHKVATMLWRYADEARIIPYPEHAFPLVILPKNRASSSWPNAIKRKIDNRLMPLFDKILTRKRSILETINDQLKNISQIVHTRHRSPINFLVNLIAGLLVYRFANSIRPFHISGSGCIEKE